MVPRQAGAANRVLSGAMVRRLAVVLLVPAMVLTGCSGGDDDVASSTTFAPPLTNPPLPTSPTSDEPSDDESTTTSTGPVDTTSPDTTPEEGSSTTSSTVTVTSAPDDTTATTQPDEFDWVAIVQGLYDTLDDINADPDVLRIDEFCVDVESPCRDVQGAQVEALVRDGWRVVDVPRTEVLRAEFTATADGKAPLESTLVILEVELMPAQDGGQVIDADGTVLFEITADDSASIRANWLVRHIDGVGWRVFEIQ